MMKPSFLLFGLLILNSATIAQAALNLPSIFGDQMVLQRDQPLPIWGWDTPGQAVSVAIGEQHKEAVTDSSGAWKVVLDPLPTSRRPLTITIAGTETKIFRDVLVGEVWLCSGQSNMGFALSQANDAELETLAAHHPQIRMITVPHVGTQEPQTDFRGKWLVCSPESVASFSAVGYHFGTLLHQVLDVPIGLIDNSWGGSAAEAWVRRDILDNHPTFTELMEAFREKEATYDFEADQADYQRRLDKWEAEAAQAKAEGKRASNRPWFSGNWMTGQSRPGNLYAGVLHPIIGYGLRGVIWYQGEANTQRAWQYRTLFPLLIQSWRDEWRQGDFPFYWVQLADFMYEPEEPGDSGWAELREAQTLTLDRVSHTGQAVIINLGEGADIHPKNKRDVAYRLARWALAKDYGFDDLVHRSPTYASMEVADSKIIVDFDHVGAGLDTFDVPEVEGFSIAGEDGKFVWAEAEIISPNQVRVWSEKVTSPVAVRYAWAANPVCNLQNKEGLPATPFRTDDWTLSTQPH